MSHIVSSDFFAEAANLESGQETFQQTYSSRANLHKTRVSASEVTRHLALPEHSETADESLRRRPRLAIFVSGGGSNFRKIHEAILDHFIRAEAAVRLELFSN